jgi:endonuclease/exonuclease/phosphatase family metal-dependent hydrolase
MRNRASAGLLAALLGAGVVLAPTAATAQTTDHPVLRPSAPTGLHVVAVTGSSFTVVANRAAHTQTYRMYASTTRSNLFARNLGRAKQSRASKSPRLTITGLHARSAPYYYRLLAINHTRQKLSALIGEVGLRPARPANLRVTSSHARTVVAWQGKTPDGWRIEQATNPQMTADRKSYRIYGALARYTPYGLHRGDRYYFRVQAMNHTTRSPATRPVGVVDRDPQMAVSVMTYNVLEAFGDGRREGSGVVAPWSKRKPKVAAMIEAAHPDVVGIQEAATLISHRHGGVRQIDTLRSALHGNYGLAHTERTPRQLHTRLTGNYILYRKSAYEAVGKGNHWELGDTRTAAYQVLRNRQTGGRFLFVSAHLIDPRGRSYDEKRLRETKVLIRDGHKMASRKGIPVVYVGDFNSDQYRHAFNAPVDAMTKAHVANAFSVAQHRRFARFNSANNYDRRPPRNFAHIDYVFTPQGVSVRSWRIEIHLRHGQFVGTIPSDHNPVIVSLGIPY